MKQREGFWQWYSKVIKEIWKNEFFLGLLEFIFISGSGLFLVIASISYLIETALEKGLSPLLLPWLVVIPAGITIFAYGIYRFKRRITND